MSNNNPPFHPGQRVVRTGPSTKYVNNGHTYTVTECTLCKCGRWHIDVGIVDERIADLHCTHCFSILVKRTDKMLYDSDKFAPISPRHQDVEIVEDLLRQPVEERLDAPVGNPIKIVKEDTVKIDTSKIVLP